MKKVRFCFFILLTIIMSQLAFAANSSYLLQRGKACWKSGRFDTAIRYFNNYRKLNQNNIEESAKATFWMGKCNYYKWDIEKAVELFKEVQQKFSQSSIAPDAAKWIGDVYYFNRDYNSAINYYKKFLSEFSAHKFVPFVNFQIGNAYYKLKKYTESKVYFQIVLSRFPNDKIKTQCQFKYNLVNKLLQNNK